MDFSGTKGGFSSGKKNYSGDSGFSSTDTGTGDTSGIVGGIGSTIGTIGDIIIGGLNYDTAQKNYELQKKLLKYNKKQQSIQYEREDNAVLRRVADLQRAGLNKVLATGSAAGSGAVVSTQAPQKAMLDKLPKFDAQAAAMAMIMQRAQIDKTYSENELIKAQKDKVDIEKILTGAKANQSLIDLEIQRLTGSHSNPGREGKIARDATAYAKKAYDALSNVSRSAKREIGSKVVEAGTGLNNVVDLVKGAYQNANKRYKQIIGVEK